MDYWSWILITMAVLTVIAVYLSIMPFFRKEIKKEYPTYDYKKANRDIESKNKKDLGKCPVCGRKLKPGDKLFTRTYHAQPRDRVFIIGCSFCKNSDNNKG